jgi:hypothetical protein
MMTFRSLAPAFLLAGALCAQATAPPSQSAPPAVAAPQAAPAPRPLLRAQYQWGYVGADGQGKGTLSVLIDPATGRTVLELQGLGERLMLVDGDSSAGYRVQIPRQKLDEKAPTLSALPLPFFPQLGGPDGLYGMLADGTGTGVKVTRKDAKGPVKLRYQGNDDKGREVMVWLERTRWELEPRAL